MDVQQNHYVGAVLAQTELFISLTNRLDGWSDLIVAGDHNALSDLLNSNDLTLLIDSVHTSRAALKMLQQPEPDSDEKSLAKSDLDAAYKKLVHSNAKLRILVNSGKLFTRTMLNALAGDTAENSAYNELAYASRINSNYLRGDV